MQKGHGEKLSRVQERAIAALLTEPSIKTAARKAKIGERTLRQWLADPEFKAAFRTECRAVLSAATGRLQALTTAAVAALGRNLSARRPADQLKAVDLVLGHVTRLAELCDLAEEVENLKRHLGPTNAAAGTAETN